MRVQDGRTLLPHLLPHLEISFEFLWCHDTWALCSKMLHAAWCSSTGSKKSQIMNDGGDGGRNAASDMPVIAEKHMPHLTELVTVARLSELQASCEATSRSKRMQELAWKVGRLRLSIN
ncbi:hypothetical protein AK812_SmicGene34535 [Symbiodinium microadriaticum]|uniref:Uncharacterized protein n=1 Tax=Symbiodinium microadriaticum TaxID=2951 RepID=A0A1Q9CNS3_SYMMI|nr:hypothetical protein AK812_SmicGene34535 [Symbiodinium microadriaticum]